MKKKKTEKYFSIPGSVLNNLELSKTPTTIKHESKKLEIIGFFLS
tara:strand:- start:702 stop:836 length:135 start_codon:yes stop_codon:yes gene_type:complete